MNANVLEYLLCVIPLGSVFIALILLVLRIPGSVGPTLTRRRLLFVFLCLLVGLASYLFAAHVIQSI